MSFWGGDETIYVSSVIYQLGDELDKIPDVIKAAIIGAGMKSTSRSYAIKKSIIDGGGIKLRQGYNYAAKSYYAGLPIGLNQIGTEADNPMLVAMVTEYLTAFYSPTAIELKSVSVEYTTNYDTILRQQIETKYNYDFFEEAVHTSVFGIPVGSTLLLEAIQDDPIGHDAELGWRLTFTKPDTSTMSFDEWYLETLFDGVDAIVENRILMEVSIGGAPSITLSYSYGGADSRLNLYLRSVTTPQRTTFPAIVLKKKNKWINTNSFYDNSFHAADWWKSQPAYKTSKIYGRRMGIDISRLIKIVKESPDEGKIDYIFIQPGTIISSPNLAAIEYHYNYFNRLRLTMPDGKPAFDAWEARIGTTMEKSEAKKCPAQFVKIYDPDDTKGTVNMTLAWRYMTYEEKTGALAKPYEIECGPQDRKVSFFSWKGARKNVKYDFCSLYIRKRLTDTTYAELMIRGLWHENYVYKGKTVKSGVWDAFNDPDGDYGTGMIIPLDVVVLQTLSAREQLQLSQETQHIIFNCYKVVKEKWYQTGIFKVVMIIISIVVIIISWGTLAPYVAALNAALYGGLVAIGIAATIAMALAAVLTIVIIAGALYAVSLIAKEAGEWAAEHWGSFWGAVVQIVVSYVLTLGLGWAAGAALGVASVPMTLVQQVVMAASMVISGLAAFTQYEMELIQEEAKQWNSYIDSTANPQKQLEVLWEENFPDMKLPAQMWFMPIEAPAEFFARTVNGVDTLVMRLIAPIEQLSEMTLTTRLQ